MYKLAARDNKQPRDRPAQVRLAARAPERTAWFVPCCWTRKDAVRATQTALVTAALRSLCAALDAPLPLLLDGV